MSNFEKANKLASEWVESMGGLDNISYRYGDDVSGLVQAIDDAGLLAPDLPEPDSHDDENIYWIEGTFQVGVSNKFGKMQVTFLDSEPGGVLYTDIESARDYALKILAACEYTEKEQDND